MLLERNCKTISRTNEDGFLLYLAWDNS